MANNKMLIDATHPEETRVVTVHGSRVEEFDFEAANRRQLRGNIYLAKVTRVEPSLQAAFVEYGGNRHGFLAFNEIHPDYYQIPLADRQALLEDEARDAEEHREREERRRSTRRHRGRRAEAAARNADATVSEDAVPAVIDLEAESVSEAAPADEAVPVTGGDASADLPDSATASAEPGDEAPAAEGEPAESAPAAEAAQESTHEPAVSGEPAPGPAPEAVVAVAEVLTVVEDLARDEASEDEDADEDDEDSDDESDEDEDEDDSDDEDGEESEDGEDSEGRIAQVGGNGDALAEIPERPRSPRRHYKIQEVIKRRQIILVQVVKEERGTKGAALTTYLSLAGRYSVLMPNTGRGGGISRKITSAADRKRLKEVVSDLDVPEGMGVILRTAGAMRTKPEIKRDFEYLMRLWESVRELTLTSMAPALVYEEGSLIKRAIRDLYNKDLEEVLVAGEDAYREAKDFMRMLMPGQSKVVKPYRDTTPVFARYGVEQQLDQMFSTHVSLKSGGYLVINPTEALVSIDVNSGRATREHDIEDTALKTNLEAAEEVARQLRLRDLAGLIVIDFIDMEEKRNNRAVEKKLNECLKNDRARIQVGRISPFGLLEMSRQRIRTGVLESSSIPCPHCGGSGFVRATSSVALHILRSIEEALVKSASHNLVLRTRTEAALYILNHKRAHLRELELRFGVTLTIAADERLAASTPFQLDRGEPAQRPEAPATAVRATAVSPAMEIDDEIDEEDLAEEEAEARAEDGEEAAEARGEDGEGRRRRRRRRRRGGRSEGNGERRESEGDEDGAEEGEESEAVEAAEAGDGAEPSESAEGEGEAEAGRSEQAGDEGGRRRRRRGRRGGRGRSDQRGREDGADEAGEETDADAEREEAVAALAPEEPVSAEALAQAAETPAAPVPLEASVDLPVAASSEPAAETAAEPVTAAAEPALAPVPPPEPVAVVLSAPSDPDRPKRAGWWSRTKAALTGE
ncbi:Rne/Rng family ribonuclease [Methylobacterium dankookense]|uniref:Ribonuclease E n=1 Tax=Methylobacterium dankookense TaxID=560405 RepID=A0A564G387_9HYPH|nr:ribonuclease E/G [Methylobacterium dankookense]GJD58277.1 Ribonuclease E [Methylobacterium dankookense]VUF14969.1 Ribonuclease E [Methylobacterium dankookense]